LATNKARTCEKGIYCHIVVTVQIIVAHGQQSNFTDANGNYAGSAFRYRESTRFVDRNGSFAGTAIPHSGSTSLYDKSGRYAGSVTTQRHREQSARQRQREQSFWARRSQMNKSKRATDELNIALSKVSTAFSLLEHMIGELPDGLSQKRALVRLTEEGKKACESALDHVLEVKKHASAI